MSVSKRVKAIHDLLGGAPAGRQFSFSNAVELFQKMPELKFKQSMDVAINLGVNA